MRKSSILNGIKWNYFGAVFKGGAQLAILGIMARLLSPEEFGVMGLALVAVKFGSYFSDFGLSAAIQQKKEITDSDISVSFWFSIVAGIVICTITFYLSGPLSLFFSSPKLELVVQWLSLNFVLTGASSTATGLLKRGMRFKYLTIIETVAYLIGNAGVGMLMAYFGYGVLSLVFANLSQSAVMCLVAYAGTRHSIAIPKNATEYKQVLTFGGGYSVASFMTFIAGNIDHFLLGKFFSPADLGLWNRSRNLILVPIYSLHISITRVLFPAYSQNQHDRVKFTELYLSGLATTGFILITIGAGMFAASEQLVDVLLGKNWQGAVPFVQLSALFVPAEMLASFAATACTALGMLSTQIRFQLALLCCLIPVMLYFSIHAKLYLVVCSLAVYFWVRFLAYLIIIGKKLRINFRVHLGVIFLFVNSAAWIWALIYLATGLKSQLSPFQLLPIQILVGAIAALFFVFFGPAKKIRVALLSHFSKQPRKGLLGRVFKVLLKPGY